MSKQVFQCVGCSFYDPDFGCLAEFEWERPRSNVAPPWVEEVSGDVEKYLRIDPSGEISWINIDRVPYEWCDADGICLGQIYAAIGCDCMVQVRTVLPGIVILVDESGKLKNPPRRHNEIASRLYLGYLRGMDDICGPAIVCAMRPTNPIGEMNLFPLAPVELAKLSLYLGVQLPDQEVPGDE